MTSINLASVNAIPSGLDSVFRDRIVELKMFPEAAANALKLARDPACSTAKLSAILERDPLLVAQLLRMANSAAFSAGVSVINVQTAVTRLGFRRCQNLIMSTCFSSLLKDMSLNEAWIREVLTQHSFMTAMLAVHLNKTLKCGFQGEELTAGLMHDFGRIMLASFMPDEFAKFDMLDFLEDRETPTRESEIASTNHCVAGSWFAEANELPEEICEVIQFHHNPSADCSHHRLVALIAAADHMANHIQRGEGPEFYLWQENTAISILQECGVRNAESQYFESVHAIMTMSIRDAAELIPFEAVSNRPSRAMASCGETSNQAIGSGTGMPMQHLPS